MGLLSKSPDRSGTDIIDPHYPTPLWFVARQDEDTSASNELRDNDGPFLTGICVIVPTALEGMTPEGDRCPSLGGDGWGG